jgi:hypothetical protein
VTVGETLTGVPLVTAPTPIFTLPVPLLNTAVRVVELPVVIVASAGVKLVITGAAITVNVIVPEVATPPWESVTLTVKVTGPGAIDDEIVPEIAPELLNAKPVGRLPVFIAQLNGPTPPVCERVVE